MNAACEHDSTATPDGGNGPTPIAVIGLARAPDPRPFRDPPFPCRGLPTLTSVDRLHGHHLDRRSP